MQAAIRFAAITDAPGANHEIRPTPAKCSRFKIGGGVERSQGADPGIALVPSAYYYFGKRIPCRWAFHLRSPSAYFASSTGTSWGSPSTNILAESKNPATVKWKRTGLWPLFSQNQP